MQRGTAGLYQLYERGIMPSILHAAAGRGKVETINGVSTHVPDFGPGSVAVRVISDTVIFYTADDSFNSFSNLVHSSFMLLQSGIAGRYPFRGAIGYGDLLDDNRAILVGSAIEDAYVGESAQAWSGCMLTEACRKYVAAQGFAERRKEICRALSVSHADRNGREFARENANILTPYSVPTQNKKSSGKINYRNFETIVIDWTIRMFEAASEKAFLASSNPHAQKIAQNTTAFESWARMSNR